MLEILKDEVEVPESLFHWAKILDRYYIEARYPNSFPEGSPTDFFDKEIAEEVINAAREIIKFSKSIINKL